jgi:hypothetical protein
MRSCQKTNKRLADALGKAKEAWKSNKRRKTEEKAAREALAGPLQPNTTPVLGPVEPSGALGEVRLIFCYCFSPHVVNALLEHSRL